MSPILEQLIDTLATSSLTGRKGGPIIHNL